MCSWPCLTLSLLKINGFLFQPCDNFPDKRKFKGCNNFIPVLVLVLDGERVEQGRKHLWSPAGVNQGDVGYVHPTAGGT